MAEEESKVHIDCLPEDVLSGVLGFLSIPDICRASSVCSRWHRNCAEDRLWLKLRENLPFVHYHQVDLPTNRSFVAHTYRILSKVYRRPHVRVKPVSELREQMKVKMVLTGPSGCGLSSLTDTLSGRPFPLVPAPQDMRIRRLFYTNADDTDDFPLLVLSITEKHSGLVPTPFSATLYEGDTVLAIVFDVTNPDSVREMHEVFGGIRAAVTPQKLLAMPKILLGNKCDGVDAPLVNREHALALAAQYSMHYVEVSALKGIGLDLAARLALQTVFPQMF
eukprot:TRINITY_DN2897_c0_g1_i2.p1 TRINITY_DN2897_c0_g1~~TRINITY_DN2897_c0_g1_i2.p1  ORF type:complete len:278 (+),score=36.18 TRINITY_DN2897_c0_g1_i2:106-939(+)